MDSERQLQIRAGVFTLVVLLLLGVGIATVTREGGLFTPRYTLYAEFDNIEGLTENAPVHLAGNDIGRVNRIQFLEPGGKHAIRVELDLNAQVADRIRTDSQATIRMFGLLGDMYVAITLGTDAGSAIRDRGTIPTAEPLSLTVLTDRGAELLDHLVALSASTEQMVGQLGETMEGSSIADTVSAFQRIVDQVERGDGLVHRMIYDDQGGEIFDELTASFKDLRSLIREVKVGDGPLHSLIYEDEEGSTLEALRNAARRLDNVLTRIDAGEGTLGALVNDPGLYDDMRLVLRGARDSRLLRALIDYVRTEDSPTP